jgi:general secretion pathway protein H
MTLLELLVVMTVLAMVANLFPLALQRVLPARRLAAAARALTLHLRELQSQSAISGQPLQLTLDASGFSVQQANRASAAHISWTGIEATLRVDSSLQRLRTLTMYPDGSSSGGDFELRSGPHRATITVSPLTGHARQSQ